MKKVELLTFTEYLKEINPKNESHPDSAYSNVSLESMNSYNSPEEYSTLLYRFKNCGVEFQMKQKTIDMTDESYVKHDKDGDILRDEKGLAICYTKEELIKKIKKENRYKYENAIVETKSQKVIAFTSDEWGCLLVQVANEYLGMGLGEKILTEQRKKNPFRHSGGFTPDGQRTIFKVYQNKIKDFMINGGYSKAVMNGEININQVKRILNSALITKKHLSNEKIEYISKYKIETYRERINKKKEKEQLYDLSDPKDILLHTDKNVVYLYNKKLFKIIGNDNNYPENFIEKGMFGYAYIGGTYHTESTPKLFRIYAKNDKIKSFLIEVALNLFENEKINIFDEDWNSISDNLKSKLLINKKEGSMTSVVLENKTMDNLDILNFIDRKFRKENDVYDEKWTIIQERMYALAEENYQNNEPNIRRTKTKYRF